MNLLGLRLIGLPAALGCLGDEALLDGTCGHADVFYRAFFVDDLHALQVRVKLPLYDRLHVTANTALFLRLTASFDGAAGDRFLAGDFANT